MAQEEFSSHNLGWVKQVLPIVLRPRTWLSPQLQELDERMAEVNTMIRQFEDGACPICYERKQYTLETTCGHSLCSDCIEDWFKDHPQNETCPYCRTSLQGLTLFPSREKFPDLLPRFSGMMKAVASLRTMMLEIHDVETRDMFRYLPFEDDIPVESYMSTMSGSQQPEPVEEEQQYALIKIDW